MPDKIYIGGLPGIPKPNYPGLRPATTYPVLTRAINRLDHYKYPNLDKADIKPMDWSDPYATSNILGTTSNANEIKINPTMLSIMPEYETDKTLAHELTHVKQNLTKNLGDRFRQTLVPYESRPNEIEAFKAGNDYMDKLPREYIAGQYSRAASMYPLLFPGIPPLLPDK